MHVHTQHDTHDATTHGVATHDAGTAPAAAPVDEQALAAFVGRLATEVAGAWGVVAIHVGVRLGLYRALVGAPADAATLAQRTGTNSRLVQEWLTGQAVSGYLEVDHAGRYVLTAERAAVLGIDDSPFYLGGLAEVLSATVRGQERFDAAFRRNGALAWGDQHPSLWAGFDHSFGPVYRAALVDAWIPAVDGLADALAAGARVADVGAGHGTAVALMARAFPAATFTAVDVHRASLDAAVRTAAEHGVTEQVGVQLADGRSFDGGPYDVITFFDSLHDMGDPEQVVAQTRRQLADDGIVLVVEPMTADGPDDEAGGLAARLFYPSSALLCTPSGLAGGSTALGNQVPDEVWAKHFHSNGFRSFERVAQTPFNRVFAARP